VAGSSTPPANLTYKDVVFDDPGSQQRSLPKTHTGRAYDACVMLAKETLAHHLSTDNHSFRALHATIPRY